MLHLMTPSRSLIVALALIAVTASFPVVYAQDVPTEEPGGDENLPRPEAEWTFLVWLDSDNNLEEYGVADLNEMETAGSTDMVNIVAQMDRLEGYDDTNGDWTGTKRYLVSQDDDMSTINSVELDDLGEVNMGDPESVYDFLDWAVANFPAKHYFLDFWNHGGGIRGVCWDDTDEDNLDVPEIGDVCSYMESLLERNVDIVGFDACIMADVSIMFELSRKADYAVASSYNEPGEGWPYHSILTKLVEKPDISPEDMAVLVADEYVKSYTDGESSTPDSPPTTPIEDGVFDLSMTGQLGMEMGKVGAYLSTKCSVQGLVRPGRHLQLQFARDSTNSYDIPGVNMPVNHVGSSYDLIDYLSEIERYLPMDSQAGMYTSSSFDAIDKAMVYSSGDPLHKNIRQGNGIATFFPNDGPGEYFPELRYAKFTYWDEFLGHYSSRSVPDNTPPMVLIDGDDIWWEPDSGNTSVTITGTSWDLEGEPVSVEVCLDGGNWVEVEGELSQWSHTFMVAPSSGNHTLSVRATDSDGSMSFEDTIQLCTRSVEEVSAEQIKAGGRTTIWIVMGIVIVAAVAVLWRMRKTRSEQ